MFCHRTALFQPSEVMLDCEGEGSSMTVENEPLDTKLGREGVFYVVEHEPSDTRWGSTSTSTF